MGRRRWRIVMIAAFLLFMTKDIHCQDDTNFYYKPVERSFAQIQPQLFPSNRPSTFYEHEDPYLAEQPTAPSSGQQPLYNDGRIRFPSPNYNQNPTPFQVPIGRSQSGSQFYINQPEFSSQRQRFRISLPQNYQIYNPASTKRPDISQIHSVAYQNNPSKPETFLGQVTLNNPDIDYLQNNRFKDIQFDGNSLKNNYHNQHSSHNEEELENDNQDLYDHPRVTTYNPSKILNRPKIIKPNPGRFPHYEGEPNFNDKTIPLHKPSLPSRTKNNPYQSQPSAPQQSSNKQDSSTEYKGMLEIESLLEDDISDISSFRELMKSTKISHDVQVIQSNNSNENEKSSDHYDNNPSASSMNADNFVKESPQSIAELSTPKAVTQNSTHSEKETSDDLLVHSHEEQEEGENEYVEYYDEETTTERHTTPKALPNEHIDEYEEYDESTEIMDHSTEIPNSSLKENSNIKSTSPQSISTTSTTTESNNSENSDETEYPSSSNETTETNPNIGLISDELESAETPSILGQEVVSVVTTKSVVNGTISIPNYTHSPKITKSGATESTPTTLVHNTSTIGPVTTENWVVVASVQTSRSVSGARFLPFPTVEQEEKKQVLSDKDDETQEDIETVTKNPKELPTTNENQQVTSLSTENINDKLDSIQSELSSAVLSGTLETENKNIEIIKETTTVKEASTTSTTPASLNVFTLRSTEATATTERSAPDPLPVHIKKFAPKIPSASTTPKPKKKLVTVMDELPPGLLPPGYKPKLSYKRTSTTTSTTSTTEAIVASIEEGEESENGTQGRSSGISSKNKVIVTDEKLPSNDVKVNLKIHENRDALIPRNKTSLEEKIKASIFDKVETVDISAFLPKDFKLNITTTTTTVQPKLKDLIEIATPVDISSFLPPGFKLNTTADIKIADVTNLLPPGYQLPKNEESTPSTQATTKAPSGGFKLVFPSRPGNKPARKSSTAKAIMEAGPQPVTPKIQKGWVTRAHTEFTGWPSPSTTPFSIEKLLEAQRNATATSPLPELSTDFTTRRSTTTSTTTLPPPPPTTPGVCRKECDIAATIKIVAGVKWVPELLDYHTEEWQKLADEVKQELNSVYSKSDLFKKWYKGIRIEGFTQGSVLVDYYIELNNIEEKIDTLELKKMFHKSLNQAQTGSYVETVKEENDDFNPDVMLGDQPSDGKMTKSDEKMTKTIDRSAGKLEIGKFVMDPAYTEFIVLPKRVEIPTMVEAEEESFLPQWGIAVIVIALASLLFVVIFGVTVLVNRQKSAKAKQPIPLNEDMLRELDKNHMGGFEDLHQFKDRDVPYQSSKRMSTAFIEQLAYQNPGDSWRSEWTPQLQKYMQHYTPDSGRGSQIYGRGGGAEYGYGGSQLYGQTGGGGGGGGGGSQLYGYTGEYPRSHYSRRRSDYDNNF